ATLIGASAGTTSTAGLTSPDGKSRPAGNSTVGIDNSTVGPGAGSPTSSKMSGKLGRTMSTTGGALGKGGGGAMLTTGAGGGSAAGAAAASGVGAAGVADGRMSPIFRSPSFSADRATGTTGASGS